MKMLLIATMALGLIGSTFAAEAPKAMTQAEIVEALAAKTGLEKAQVKSVLDELSNLAYAEARRGFTIPGIGKLVVVDRSARKGRNPLTGEEIQIPAKQSLKFRISSTCKAAVLGTGK